MNQVAVWEICNSEAKRLRASSIDFEVELEQWIDNDPDLVEFGLTVIGRTVSYRKGRTVGLRP